MGCQEITSLSHHLCGPCWKQLEFITTPCCQRCGHPFTVESLPFLCGECLQTPPLFTQARAAFRYEALIRDLILQFKHADATYLAKPLGQWLARQGQSLLVKSDIIIPVPLHRWRLFKRRYNQATLLCHELSRSSGKPVGTNCLQRVKNTPSQHGKSRKAREKNVMGVFKVPPSKQEVIRKKSILLIDDVWTTGSTLNACIKALKKAGAKDVYILTLARVIKAS